MDCQAYKEKTTSYLL